MDQFVVIVDTALPRVETHIYACENQFDAQTFKDEVEDAGDIARVMPLEHGRPARYNHA